MTMNACESNWFNDGKYGLFIHFGLYSMLGGLWKGVETPGIAEWIQLSLDIPRDEYAELAQDFNPTKLDPDEICRRAKEDWGMTYLCLTSKHHDGFALYDSKVSPYNSVQASPCQRDIVREFSEACQKHGLVFCLYYSQAQDWHEPGGLWAYRENDPQAFEDYFKRKCLPQVEELLTNYGPLGMIWFDTPMSMTEEQAVLLRQLVKRHQPDCLISGRIGHGQSDYLSTGDNLLPANPIPQAWELPATLNNSWGYKIHDHHWRKAEHVLRELMKVVSRGGNYLLNIGPRGDGSVPEESLAVLDAVGQVVKQSSEGIYGTRVAPPYVYEQDNFVLLTKPHRLYCFIMGPESRGGDRDEGRKTPLEQGFLELFNIANEVTSVRCLSHPIEVEFKDGTDLEGHSYWRVQWEPQEGMVVLAFELQEETITMESI